MLQYESYNCIRNSSMRNYLVRTKQNSYMFYIDFFFIAMVNKLSHVSRITLSTVKLFLCFGIFSGCLPFLTKDDSAAGTCSA